MRRCEENADADAEQVPHSDRTPSLLHTSPAAASASESPLAALGTTMPAHATTCKAPGQGAAFHVFSVRPKAVLGAPDTPSDPNGDAGTSKQYTTRKSHRKSRLGCNACKSKRVKCDEQRPACGRCQRTKSTCDYSSASSVSTRRFAPQTRPKAEHDAALLSAIVVPASIDRLSRDAFLLKHYDVFTGGAIDTITCTHMLAGTSSDEYRMGVLRLAHKYPYLMHAVLAVAALHLTFHRVPGYWLVKLSHVQASLFGLQKAIRKPFTKEEADAILIASMMINLQHFSWIESELPEDSWVFSAEPSRLDWLAVQLSLLDLIKSTSHFHEESLLAPLWRSATYPLAGTEGLPPAMVKLCEVDDEMTDTEKERNPYYLGLQLLAPLMIIERGSVVQYARFVRALPRAFFELAQNNDERAMLILSYWFGLMCHVDFWWILRRAKRDCTALCMYLDRNADYRVRDLLDFPAQACGYQIKGQRGYIIEEEEREEQDPTLSRF